MAEQHDDPIYVISVVARMVGVHAQTLRYYERAGLIEPSRSDGNRRYYSQREVDLLRRIKTMMDDMGMNLAGVEVCLRLMARITELESHLQQALEELQHMDAREQRPALTEAKPSAGGAAS